MSKYNEYARRLDAMAREEFETVKKAQAALDEAERSVRLYPDRYGIVDAEYAAKNARAAADLAEARANMNSVQRHFAESMDAAKKLRGELLAAVDADYGAKPDDVDTNTLELLKSGILTGADYVRLMDAAMGERNFTMAKLISKYAGEADSDKSLAYEARAPFVSVVERGKAVNGSQYIDAFDDLTAIYRRCLDNPMLIERWDEFTSEAVEAF